VSEWLKTACRDYGQLEHSKSIGKKGLARGVDRAAQQPAGPAVAGEHAATGHAYLAGRATRHRDWPIKGEFDPLPALHRWKEDGELLDQPQPRRIGLPVVNKETHTMTFHAWYPGCPMEEDAYGIPKPKDTEIIVPTLLFAPCVGYGPGGFRLGYGGGFYDRMLANLNPKPFSVGLGFGMGFLPDFEPEPHDMPLDAILNDYGVVWPV
jgi:5-formyltetrahydrofolate cyclo-ligase